MKQTNEHTDFRKKFRYKDVSNEQQLLIKEKVNGAAHRRKKYRHNKQEKYYQFISENKQIKSVL